MNVNVGYFSNVKFKRKIDRDWEISEEEMAISFAKALKYIRKYLGHSLQTVSKNTDIPFQTISRYENGENTPSIIQAYKLAYFYGFSVNDMFIIGLFDVLEIYYEDILSNWKR